MPNYSFDDIHCAKIVVNNVHLFDDTFIMWASEVLTWWQYFKQLIRLYSEYANNGYRMGVKLAWENIKRWSLRFLLKRMEDISSCFNRRDKKTLYDDNPFNTMSVRTKYQRWAKNASKTNYMQTSVFV